MIRPLHPSRLWLIVALLVGATIPALAQRGGKSAAPSAPAPDNATCLACHGDADAKRADGTSIAVDEKKFGDSIHGSLGLQCVVCHADLAKTSDFPHAEKLAKVNCAQCHADAKAAYDTSIHAAARRKSATSVAPACVDCHSAHDIRSAKDPLSSTYPLNLPATCSRCHGDAKIIKQGNIRIGNVAALYKDSIHGHAVTVSGLLVAANCTSCHGSHDIREKNDPQSKVNRANIPSTCGSCHEGIKTLYDQSAHGVARAAGNPKAPVCIDCHSAHGIQRADNANWRLDTVRECGTCHLDKIKTYRDTFHGQVTSLGFVRVATCSDCHTPHSMQKGTDPRSTIWDGNRLKTCQTCHPTATAGFAQYDPHADKSDLSANRVLFFAAGGMKWLLIGTFGFFGLHTLLWLPRSAVARRRANAQNRTAPAPSENEKGKG
jgi:nitrate/TMAO reductase-like tetraheme cytochrome c subunit